ncbi:MULTISPECIES: hypothetical protein [unclassified Synechococcus]|uniref:hypothetical protein n=1 Tax=unclassified Synechococcus TaxID=2626047 RepID=UPI0008FFB55E|nr:hypothetical protein [Synechococcus sp. WH 8020]
MVSPLLDGNASRFAPAKAPQAPRNTNSLGTVLFNVDSTMSMRTTLLGSLAFAIVGILSLAECSEDEIRPIEAPASRKNL